jgi:MoxR-like ATPase
LALSDGEDNYSNATRQSVIAATRDLDVNKITRKDLNRYADRVANQTASSHTVARASVLKALQNADTVFYALNPSGPSVRLNIASQRAQNALQQFADETGGTAFLPQFVSERNSASFEQKNIQIFERIFSQISAELRAQYLIQYYSESEFPNNRYVKLDVGLQNPRNLRVRARQGYFVKN